MDAERAVGLPVSELRALLNLHAPTYRRGWICFCDAPESADNYPLKWTAHLLTLLSRATDAAEAQLAASRALLEEARFHVTVGRDEHSINDCHRCDLSERIGAFLDTLSNEKENRTP